MPKNKLTLQQYLNTNEMTMAVLAEQCGVTTGRISQIISGSNPSWKLALAIEKATKGQVPRETWYPGRK